MGNLRQKGRKEPPVQKTLKDKNMEGVRNAKKHQQSDSGGQSEDGIQTEPHLQSVVDETANLVHEGKDKHCCSAKERSYQSFSVICNKELVQKVKGIAKKEGLHINAVVQAMYEEGIRRYEERHGALDAEPQKKKAREILFAT